MQFVKKINNLLINGYATSKLRKYSIISYIVNQMKRKLVFNQLLRKFYIQIFKNHLND